MKAYIGNVKTDVDSHTGTISPDSGNIRDVTPRKISDLLKTKNRKRDQLQPLSHIIDAGLDNAKSLGFTQSNFVYVSYDLGIIDDVYAVVLNEDSLGLLKTTIMQKIRIYLAEKQQTSIHNIHFYIDDSSIFRFYIGLSEHEQYNYRIRLSKKIGQQAKIYVEPIDGEGIGSFTIQGNRVFLS